ncbi:hypothetical protein NMY22_g17578 [Coprinellus aureogranulatus]|nr:hypothetical protein NMY22_g17578 [Coprinellus aureogranulatus]
MHRLSSLQDEPDLLDLNGRWPSHILVLSNHDTLQNQLAGIFSGGSSVSAPPPSGGQLPYPERFWTSGPYSDASTGVGVGIVIGHKWRAWTLRSGWRTRDGVKDIGWAEAVGFYFLIVALTQLVARGTHLRLHGDNEGVVDAWRNFRSRNAATNKVFELIHDHLERYGFIDCIHPVWVPSKDNPADEPSRGVFPPTADLLPPIPIPSGLIPFIVDAVDSSCRGAGGEAPNVGAGESGYSSDEEEDNYTPPDPSSELDFLNNAIRDPV